MRVSKILSQKPGTGVVTLKPGTSVSDAASMLAEKKIGAIIIADGEGVPKGILSERDIVRELGRRGPGCLQDKVDDMMTTNLITCTGEDAADDVLGKMTDGRFRHMPVMNGGKMVGLISIGDVVKARLAELAMERDALEGMVRGH